MISIYTWLSQTIQAEYEEIALLKESPRGTVRSICHKASGHFFLLRQFAGNPKVYQKLLEVSCPNLPTVYEVAAGPENNLVLEEFIRLGAPEDVAKAIVFLASDDAAYITGQVLAVDGGMAM